MSENRFGRGIWPPIRSRAPPSIQPLAPITNDTELNARSPGFLTIIQQPSTSQPPATVPDQRQKTQYQNGYTAKPQATSYKPYNTSSCGCRSKAPFTCDPVEPLGPLCPLSEESWNMKATEAGVLAVGSQLHQYQLDAANFIIGRSGDLVIIAPTGMGKSTVWDLPLLVQRGGVSLVLVPYTTLGFQGEELHQKSSLPAVYISSMTKSEDLL
ncbi:hypothetical protein BDN70DRAFT_901547 [Pholiota conissans]|uniref:DEAD/DEAH-box helicase domain-containing protein n=1 Tax=Pholiota conissans TaxID=109636 RepID=A0A9P6CSL6_9AGAR|nr:hypothetical protein BDN70DRAFT_901547 [Pholiota conissans]